MSIFQSVKVSVTARQAAEQYGVKVNRNGMVCCPFHKDRHPSMKVEKGFYCFACGAKGGVNKQRDIGKSCKNPRGILQLSV